MLYEIEKKCYNQRFDMKFLKKIVPNTDIQYISKDNTIIVFSDEGIIAKIKKEERKCEAKGIRLKETNLITWKKPYGLQAKEIMYLENWAELGQNSSEISGIGRAVFTKSKLDVLSDISNSPHFGEFFYLIELFGVLATSLLVERKVIKLEDGYGLAEIKGLEIFHLLDDGEELFIYVKCRKSGMGTIMSGEIYSSIKLIARLERGIGMRFINVSGEVNS